MKDTWINVKERLPDKFDRVLVLFKSNTGEFITMATMYKEKRNGIAWGVESNSNIFVYPAEVTHWQPCISPEGVDLSGNNSIY